MMSVKEYGGFLPLELNCGTEYFQKYGNNVFKLNSVKAAFAYILAGMKDKTLYIPYYYCPSTTKFLCEYHNHVKYYHIDNNFYPLDVEDSEDNIIILVDYFGICHSIIANKIKEFKKSVIFVDNAHNFFTAPIMQRKIFNFYSARKFFGVPDGSYVISKELNTITQEYSESFNYAGYLLKAYELGTNSVYKEKGQVNKILDDNIGFMSKLSVGLLKNVNYDYVYRKRIDNFAIMNDNFLDINKMEIMDCLPSYVFPLLLKNGNIIKKMLIDKKIYVSTLWNTCKLNDFEKNLSDYCLFLPIDQRYDRSDMLYIIEEVRKCISCI